MKAGKNSKLNLSAMKGRTSNFSDIGVNPKYIINFQTDEDPTTGEPKLPPASLAMQWCMLGCGINRIFSEEDLKEFLFRLPILLHSQGLLDKWFGEDRLFSFRVSETRYDFSVKDIFNHYGIEVVDSLTNYSGREQFFNRLQQNLTNVMLIGALSDFSVIPPEKAGDDEIIISAGQYIPEITNELKNNAAFFAQDVLRQVPEHLFAGQGRFAEKLKEIEERKLAISQIPVFDINKLSDEFCDKCMQTMFEPEWVMKVKEADIDDYNEFKEKYIHLAWLFANDLMISDGMMAWEVEGVELDHDYFELDDGGINLLHTYEICAMKELEPVLRGLFFDQKK